MLRCFKYLGSFKIDYSIKTAINEEQNRQEKNLWAGEELGHDWDGFDNWKID